MLETVIPPYIDTRKVFLNGDKLAGTVPLSRLSGFRENLTSDEATIKIELEFSINKSKQKLITGQLSASVWVMCQRCLEPVQIHLKDTISLALLRKESDVGKLDESLDPWVIDDYKLDIAKVADEQLLLCLPIVSNHEDPNCAEQLEYSAEDLNDSAGEGNEKANPFAILKSLKE